MGTRQYIGARYVPKFADPIAWDNAREYEPLTIVTYMGTSYTSKKPVPTGVEISNSEYWVATGNYNAQVEAYREETQQLAGDVAELTEKVNGRKIIRRNRAKVFWNGENVTSVGVYETNMTGFRFMGRDYNDDDIVYIPDENYVLNQHIKVSTSNTKVTSFNDNCWQAIFGVVDDENPGYYKPYIVPIMEVLSVSDNVVTVGCSKENTDGVSLTGGIVDNIVDREVLVITRNNNIAGDVTKVIAYSGSTITLENVTNLSAGDYIIVAPAEAGKYVYFASHYTASGWRNREDDGVNAWIRGVGDTEHSYADIIYPDAATAPTNGFFKLRNCCSPMATGVIVNASVTYSSTASGRIVLAVGADFAHKRNMAIFNKTSADTSVNYGLNMMWIGFNYLRQVFIGFQTEIASAYSISIQPWGWTEP